MTEVARLIEASLWDHEPAAIPAGLELVDQPDRLHWRLPAASPLANKVVRATWTDEQAPGGIDEVLAWFQEQGKAFSWWVGPSSAPTSLAERLQARGLTLMDTYEGVALPLDLELQIPVNPAVSVAAVESEAEVRDLVQVTSRVWGYGPEDQARLIADRMAYLRHPGRRGGYLLARLDGQPVATATYRYSADGQAVYLTGASTLAEFRGRGLFTALVARRLADARERGCRVATCLARVGTSAPILMKLGFQKYITVPVYEGK